MKVKSQTTVIISIFIVLAGIVFTSVLGLWHTQSTKVPQKLKQDEDSQQYDPADIRGSYSFLEVSNLFNVPVKDLAAAFFVNGGEVNDFKCKDLEGTFANATNEIGTGSVRMFVAFYHGLPYDLTGSTYVTDRAAQLLKQNSKMTPEQLSYLETHTVMTAQSQP